MRSSTLFALLLAILLGLGVAVVAKATGFLSKAEPKKEPPPVMVLTAATNIFEGACLEASQVRLRPIHADEMEAMKRGEFLPPLTQAAVRRFAKVSIEADRPIRRDQLDDLNAPPTIKERLAQGMEAVNLAVPKVQCAGGMINVGDWVNVQLTTTITDGNGNATTSTALLARNVRVIAKRNNLWPVTQPLSQGYPMNFTLEMNPYRAALTTFVQDKGSITLSPIADADKRQLEARRSDLMSQAGVTQIAYSQPDSLEYKDEDVRVANYLQGNYAVGEGDLMRIFRVKMEEPTPPSAPPARVQQFVGVRRLGQVSFVDGKPVEEEEDRRHGGYRSTTPQQGGHSPAATPIQQTPSNASPGNASRNSGGFTFQPPNVYCPTCKKGAGSTPTVGMTGGKK